MNPDPRLGDAPVVVQTVAGPVDPDRLGVTLFHEHVFTDNRGRASLPRAGDVEGTGMADAPVSIEMLGRLHYEPLLCRDNCVLDDVFLAVEETARFKAAGGTTIIDQTPMGIGRNVAGLRKVAETTGLTVIASAGYYTAALHPPALADLDIDQVAERLVHEVSAGTEGVRAGLIGEIGISAAFTDAERRVLRAAGRAQTATGVPLSVHLPGWNRYAHEVLDELEAQGVDPAAVVLSHMNPSVGDREYQNAVAARGAWLSFDMLGIDWYFGHQDTQSPCDAEVAQAIVSLWDGGFGSQLLISCDTFLKMQLHRFGGYGYDHVPLRFLPRLHRLGMSCTDTDVLVVDNPAAVFRAAAGTQLG